MSQDDGAVSFGITVTNTGHVSAQQTVMLFARPLSVPGATTNISDRYDYNNDKCAGRCYLVCLHPGRLSPLSILGSCLVVLDNNENKLDYDIQISLSL